MNEIVRRDGALTIGKGRTFRKFRQDADFFLRWVNRILDLRKRALRALDCKPTEPSELAKLAGEFRDAFREPYGWSLLHEVRAGLDQFNPEVEYEHDPEDGKRVCASVATVREKLTRFAGSFPTSNVPEPEVFALGMLDEVYGYVHCYNEHPITIEATIRELRCREKFMQSTAEVLAELEKQEEFWADIVSWAHLLVVTDFKAKLELIRTKLEPVSVSPETRRNDHDQRQRCHPGLGRHGQ